MISNYGVYHYIYIKLRTNYLIYAQTLSHTATTRGENRVAGYTEVASSWALRSWTAVTCASWSASLASLAACAASRLA